MVLPGVSDFLSWLMTVPIIFAKGDKKGGSPPKSEPPPPPPKLEDTTATQAAADTRKRARGAMSRQLSIRNTGGASGLFGTNEGQRPSLLASGLKTKLGA